MPSRFVAPKRLESFEQTQKALQRVQEQLDALAPPKRPALIVKDTTLRAGESVRISPRSGTLHAKLPKASAENFGQTISIILERPVGTLRVSAQRPDTVAGVTATNFTVAGLIVLQSNGVDAWVTANELPSTSPGGAALDAEYVLGAAHASLPNGAVATDTAEVNVTVTPGGTATWALIDGSVVLDRLEDIPDQRLLGNDSGSDGPPEPITVHQELDWIGGSGGGSAQWVFDGIDDRIDFGNFNGFERTQAFSLSCWVPTSTAGTTRALITKIDQGTASGYQMFISTGNDLSFYAADAVVSLDLHVETTNALAAAPHHLLVTSSGNSSQTGVNLYVDGVLQAKTVVGASVSNSILNTAPLCVGGYDTAGSLAGRIEHAAVFNVELTAAQVLEVYNGGTPPDLLNLATAPAPVFWAKIDSSDVVGAGGVADYGTGNHDGTAEGGLAPTAGSAVAVGTLALRGTSLWEPLLPGTIDFPLISNGTGALPAYERLTNAGLATAAADTYKGNNTGGVASVTDVPIANLAGAGMTATGSVLNVIGSASITVNANDIQRPALTGAITASANSNATAFGTLAAKSVLANATNAVAIPAALAGSAAFQHLRVNSANNALEWAVLSAGDFPAGVVPLTGLATQAADTFLGNFTSGVASPTARAGTSIAGAGLTYTTGGTLAVGSSTSITVSADDIQRAALTGEVTAPANSNATTITRSTNFVWTGDHTFNGEAIFGEMVELVGTDTQVLSGTGISLTLGANNHIQLSGSGTFDISTMTATRDGQLVFIEYIGDGFVYLNHDTGASGFLCPGDVRYRIPSENGVWVRFNNAKTRWVVMDSANFRGLNVSDGTTTHTGLGTLTLQDTVGMDWGFSASGTSPERDMALTATITGIFAERASAPTVAAGQGAYWVRNDVPSIPMFTGDTSVDHEIVMRDNIANTSAVTLSTITGNQGTVDISALECGGSVVVSGPTGAYQIEGFTAKPDGFWFNLSTPDAQICTLFHEDVTATSTNRMRCRANADQVNIGIQAIIYYRNSRWRVIA